MTQHTADGNASGTGNDAGDRVNADIGQATDRSTYVEPQRYLTEDLPGIGGVLKSRPEDFMVDEQPQYQPCGSGEHIYLYVEKRGMSTLDMVRVVAKHFGVRRSDVGYAGLKDKHAITRQVLSVHTPGRKPEDFPQLQHEQITVQWADLHTNKLRRGHLRGNRFSIRVREVDPVAVLRAKPILDRLAASGVPNRIGEQRFGVIENNHLIGRALILGDAQAALDELLGPNANHPDNHAESRRLYTEGKFREAAALLPNGMRNELFALNVLAKGGDAHDVFSRMDESIIGFFYSAFQSAMFNRVLDARIERHAFDEFLLGDLAQKHGNRAIFSIGRAELNDPETGLRLHNFEISPTGPMWGPEMPRTRGEADELETGTLAETGVSTDQLDELDGVGFFRGERRALRVPILDPEIEGGADEHGPFVRVAFELPRGSFATVVLREIMKDDTRAAVYRRGEEHE